MQCWDAGLFGGGCYSLMSVAELISQLECHGASGGDSYCSVYALKFMCV